MRNAANSAQVAHLKKFFKTGKGQYGEGDQFIGLTVPQQRTIAIQFQELPLNDISHLLKSPIHEERLTALFILVLRFKKSDENKRKEIYNFYHKHSKCINNWDLVDASAYHIVGGYLHGKEKAVLRKLAKSKNLWERRIAMVATWYDIQQGRHETAIEIARMLLNDQHDLMHKAVGWMLREVGKRASQQALEEFLCQHCTTMPRTALRYAIERFPPEKRRQYLEGKV